MIGAVVAAAVATLRFYSALYQHIVQNKTYNTCTVFDKDRWAKVQVYSLSLIFDLWHRPHYRSSHYQQDMIDNLRNVAIPGTGLPLSILARNYLLCLFAVLFLNPLVCLFGAINKARQCCSVLKQPQEFLIKTCFYYTEHLLHPDDWFSLWRLNCRLASIYSCLSKAPGYRFEDKWTFLKEGTGLVPVSPCIDNVEHLVCKNKNVEGGLAIHFYHNALHGGDWILQQRLVNASWLLEMLPDNAPLSTMRIITMSTWPLQHPQSIVTTDVSSADPMNGASKNKTMAKKKHMKNPPDNAAGSVDEPYHDNSYEEPSIHVMSSVLRLGRKGAATDHSSVLFDVDVASGVITQGLSNAHWYQLGPKGLRAPWLPPPAQDKHPDAPSADITGQKIPDMKQAVKIVKDAHLAMMRDVPIVGWDVAFTDKGIYLLEVNLSCNFFRGSFDHSLYINIVDRYFTMLQDFSSKK